MLQILIKASIDLTSIWSSAICEPYSALKECDFYEDIQRQKGRGAKGVGPY